MFTAFNKKESSVMHQFLTSLATSAKIPHDLANDAQCLLKIANADTDSVSAVKLMLEKVAGIQTLVFFLKT